MFQRHRPVVYGRRHMVSAGHHLAAEAGFKMLEAGGNAVDAGIASIAVLAVVQPDMVNVAGVAPMMIHEAATGRTITISGLGVWPKAATPEYFIEKHNGIIPEGFLRSVVPAAPDAWIKALSAYGTMSFAEVAEPALRFARDGFATHRFLSDRIKEYEAGYRRYQSNAAIYLPGGRPPEPGDPFVQADLGATLQYMVDQENASSRHGREAGLQAARDAFYKGDIARTIDRFYRENDGLLTFADMAGFSNEIGTPIVGFYKDIEINTCGPWCQGPVLLQVLKILERFDLKGMGHNSETYIHTVAEAIKLAFADREHWYGDPNFVDVPIDGLVSDAYADLRAGLIDVVKACPRMPPAGDPTALLAKVQNSRPEPREFAIPPQEPMLADTSYACVVDKQGNVFSATPSDASWDGVVVPGTGLCPSTRGCQSRVDTSHPSAVGPGRRPRLTPNPAMVFKNGKPLMPFGSPGGDAQVQSMAQVFLNIFEFGMDVQEAVEAPRLMSQSFPNSFAPNQYYPGRLNLERRFGKALGDTLAVKGHVVHFWPDWFWRLGSVCAILIDDDNKILHAGADPRHESYAIGW